MTQSRSSPKSRISAFLIDWGIWGYISYCSFFLVDYLFRTFVALSIHDKLSFPAYGWPVVIGASLLIAVLWGNFGVSIGFKAFGLLLVDESHAAASRGARARRAPYEVLTWGGAFGALALLLVPVVGLSTLFSNLAAGTHISFIPTIPLWSIGPSLHTLGYTLLAILIVIGGGGGLAYVGFLLLRWLWWGRGRASDRFWSDRVARTRVVHVRDLGDALPPPRRWFLTTSGVMVFVLIGLTLCVGWLIMEVDIGNLIRRAPVTARMWGQLLNPDFSTAITPDPVLKDSIGTALIETIFMALAATLLGIVFAFPLSFLGARNLTAKGPLGWMIYTLTRAFFNIFRSIEVIVWAIIFAVWVSFGPFPGVMALAIHTIAALGKLYSEQVESIDPGPLEAMTAAGARKWQVIFFGVIPQIIPSFLAFTLYRWDINVRMSTIIGLVGGGGIGSMLFYYKSELMWEKAGAVVMAIVAVVWTMDYISGRVRERLT